MTVGEGIILIVLIYACLVVLVGLVVGLRRP